VNNFRVAYLSVDGTRIWVQTFSPFLYQALRPRNEPKVTFERPGYYMPNFNMTKYRAKPETVRDWHRIGNNVHLTLVKNTPADPIACS
jgi:hypothetical protein